MGWLKINQRGFTLVEILLVVTIIGVLASIAIPQLVKYKKNAAVAHCNADLKNYMTAAAALWAINATEDSTHSLIGNKFFQAQIEVSANDTQIRFTPGRDGVSGDGFEVEANKVTQDWAKHTGFTIRIDKNQANCSIVN